MRLFRIPTYKYFSKQLTNIDKDAETFSSGSALSSIWSTLKVGVFVILCHAGGCNIVQEFVLFLQQQIEIPQVCIHKGSYAASFLFFWCLYYYY
jgi:hypothetical protein